MRVCVDQRARRAVRPARSFTSTACRHPSAARSSLASCGVDQRARRAVRPARSFTSTACRHPSAARSSLASCGVSPLRRAARACSAARSASAGGRRRAARRGRAARTCCAVSCRAVLTRLPAGLVAAARTAYRANPKETHGRKSTTTCSTSTAKTRVRPGQRASGVRCGDSGERRASCTAEAGVRRVWCSPRFQALTHSARSCAGGRAVRAARRGESGERRAVRLSHAVTAVAWTCGASAPC